MADAETAAVAEPEAIAPPAEAPESAPVEETAAPIEETSASEEQQPAAPVPPWATVSDVYDLEEVPEVKAHLERRDRDVEQRIRNEADQRVAAEVRAVETKEVFRRLGGDMARLLERVDSGDIEGSSRFLDRIETLIRPYADEFQGQLRQEGEARQAASVFGTMLDSLSRRDKDDLREWVQRRSANWEQTLSQYAKVKAAPEIERLKTDLANANDTISRLKAEGRTNKGPSLAQGAPGGNNIDSYEEAARRYNLPIGHPQKLSHEDFTEQRRRFGIK